MKNPAPRETILSLFSQTPDGFVSGEYISAELGISRTAVWKHIRNLRQAGLRDQGDTVTRLSITTVS